MDILRHGLEKSLEEELIAYIPQEHEACLTTTQGHSRFGRVWSKGIGKDWARNFIRCLQQMKDRAIWIVYDWLVFPLSLGLRIVFGGLVYDSRMIYDG